MEVQNNLHQYISLIQRDLQTRDTALVEAKSNLHQLNTQIQWTLQWKGGGGGKKKIIHDKLMVDYMFFTNNSYRFRYRYR